MPHVSNLDCFELETGHYNLTMSFLIPFCPSLFLSWDYLISSLKWQCSSQKLRFLRILLVRKDNVVGTSHGIWNNSFSLLAHLPLHFFSSFWFCKSLISNFFNGSLLFKDTSFRGFKVCDSHCLRKILAITDSTSSVCLNWYQAEQLPIKSWKVKILNRISFTGAWVA